MGATDVRETVYRPEHPVSLRHVLGPLVRGAADPTHRWEGAALWRTVLTPDGPATLHLAVSGAAVHATAWGPGAERAIAGVPELCGAGDDWDGLDVSDRPFLAEARRRVPGLRLTRTNAVFEALVAGILEQKVTGLEARRAWRWLVTAYGAVAPGPAPEGMRVIPAPEVWRRIPSWDWHRAGVGPNRSETAVRAATVASSLERTLELGRGGEEVARRLRSLPGIGVWTAAETTQRAHGDPDSPSVGDYHLASLVGWALVGAPVDDDGMLELLAPYAGHRHRVVRLIEASGFRKPAFGPRMTVQDHRRH
ncbi:DNA-3-methyladenine glycosylase family protein [Galbitalea soli]|uniref:DNA-3-methyladenine glycosylase 2 family protein n=1 Tax=Galbitalea soli TaxID=1268042 RepID=A0A7C9PPR7_9MICO|nr:DNA-3-methyladenine glycosylase 2 family protein [Galbitalea soli]NEM92467.1 DNA-3-methyladenine glycosylase 2 family protein [Galbitalea soli]NYJ29502.1 3-methyladenine DNA glycosylase/8-oxoguanine DNA glycosylase [Galbitalea soli]